MDVDAITRLIIRIVPSVADRAFAARAQWSKSPSETDAKLIREYLELGQRVQVLGEYRPVKSIGSALAALDEVQQYSLLFSAKLCEYEPASLAVQAIAVATAKSRRNWMPVMEVDATGSTTPGVFGAFIEDLGALRELLEPLLRALHEVVAS